MHSKTLVAPRPTDRGRAPGGDAAGPDRCHKRMEDLIKEENFNAFLKVRALPAPEHAPRPPDPSPEAWCVAGRRESMRLLRS
jgi:hypothetical protein